MKSSNSEKQIVPIDKTLNKYQGMPLPKWKIEKAKAALPGAAEAIRMLKENRPKQND